MKVLITGIDGYLGWPLALHLKSRGHDVAGIDNGLRRRLVAEVGSQSAIPIESTMERSRQIGIYHCDLTDWERMSIAFRELQPDCVVYLGQMPSAPYSMMSHEKAAFTHNNNVTGHLNTLYAIREFCPQSHLVKIGSMGEYGTPDCPVPEGVFPPGSFWSMDWVGEPDGFEREFPTTSHDISGMLFPRRAGSWYHLTKVHDTHNVDFACRNWGLRATDIMQGVVYGTRTDEATTRFDFDGCFGTVVNRFCAQAVIGEPLTPYGKGEQKRGFLPLRDSIQCLTIAVEQPPQPGEYRTWNQLEAVYSVNELAGHVQRIGGELGMDVRIEPITNPRHEAEQHRYDVWTNTLPSLGYKPTGDLDGELRTILGDLREHRGRIEECRGALSPLVKWR